MTATETDLTTHPEFVAMLAATSEGTQRFLILADWCQDHDAPAALVTACRVMHEPQKIGPRTWRAFLSAKGNGYYVSGKAPRAGRGTGVRYVGHEFAGVVAAVAEALDAEAEKAAWRAAKSARLAELVAGWVNPFKVGDLLSNSWGYEQTNWEFAEVVKVGPRSVTIRPVARRESRPSGQWAVEHVAPVKGAFTGEAKSVRITFRVWEGRLRFLVPAKYGSWSPVGDREEFTATSYA